MSEEVLRSQKDFFKTTKIYLQLDESTIKKVFTTGRFIKVKSINQELLFTRTSNAETKRNSKLEVPGHHFKEMIPLTNTLVVATIGDPAMVGPYRRLVSCLKKVIAHEVATHCWIHTHHLAANTLVTFIFHYSMQLQKLTRLEAMFLMINLEIFVVKKTNT